MEEQTSRSLERRIRRHVIAGSHRYFAVFQPGFEEAVRQELQEMGVAEIKQQVPGGLEFEGSLIDSYRINLCSATLTRLLLRLGAFKALHESRFRKRMGEIPWELHLAPSTLVDFSITCRRSRLRHTGMLRELAAKAVSERLASQGFAGTLPEGKLSPCQTVFLRFEEDVCTVSLDTSGEPLYRRNLRTHVTEAPLRETLAALILREAGLDRCDLLLDPMGGSGVFSLEGARFYQRTPPGLTRDFIFQSWPAFRSPAFFHLRKCLQEESPPSMDGIVQYADKSGKALQAALDNFTAAGLADRILVHRRDFFQEPPVIPSGRRALLVLNPPYGKRLDTGESPPRLYRKIGAVLKSYGKECGWAVIVPDRECEAALGLTWERKIPFQNGGLRVAVLIRRAVETGRIFRREAEE